jgi:CheY-like chemotaxis protein
MESPAKEPTYSVLVVDDLEDNRDLLSQWLERHGYKVLTASNGTEAFEVLSSKSVDLVLLDIQMPQMDGFEFLKHLRSDEHFRSTPVICLTAHFSEPYHLSRGLTFASAYFTKPFSFNDLLMKIEVVIQSRRPKGSHSRLPMNPQEEPPEAD